MHRVRATALAALVLAASAYALDRSSAAAGATTYHLDCRTGNDAAAGTSPTTAWRTIARANKATLLPGDALLFARDCTWQNEKLLARWNGTPDDPILISAYGLGAAPSLVAGQQSVVIKMTGSYTAIDGLSISATVKRRSACGNPLGTDYGINIVEPGNNNIVRRSSVSGFQAGIRIGQNSFQNKIAFNAIFGNNMVDDFHADPTWDLGAWGVLLNGDNNEVANNRFRDNRAVCANGTYKLQSNSVEIYGGRGNRIHHNRAFGDRVFSELGGPAGDRAIGNSFAYNLFANDLAFSRFIVTRGADQAAYGPVLNTSVLHNTVHLTGANSEGVICGAGCNRDLLSLRNNIIWVDNRAVYADAPFDEGGNLFWAGNGRPVMTIPGGISSSSKIGDPQFVNPANFNYRLRWSSPARDAAGQARVPYTLPTPDALDGVFSVDLGRQAVPQSGNPDVGAFEFVPMPSRASGAVAGAAAVRSSLVDPDDDADGAGVGDDGFS